MTVDAERAIDRVLAAFDGVHPHGESWLALCPVHADRRPSVDIKQGTAGVVITCRAGCDTGEVLAARGLTFRDLFDTDKPTSNGAAAKRTIVTAYPYVDELGELLFEVVRYEPKDFRQRKPDGNGGWDWKTADVRKVLYQLPDVLDGIAAGVNVWVAEGEKDVHALARAGQIATTNPGGAGPNKWKPEYTESLRGARVVIVCDDDEPGRKHARAIAASLTGVAESVDMRLPAPGFKDVAEHLGAGKTLKQLRPFAEPEPETPDTSEDRLAVAAGITPIDWPAFWADEGPTEEWLCEPIVPAGRQVALFASAKAGKSLITLEIAAAIAVGRAVLSRPASEPQPVVYIDQEMTDADLRERLIDLGYGPDDDLSRLHYYQLESLPPLDGDLGGLILEDIAAMHGAVLVVLDTMARVVSGDENDSDTYRNFYRSTGSRLKAAGVALLRLDHGGKHLEKGQRGSSAKADDVDVVFQLTANGPTLTIKRTHSRVPWVPFQLTITREVEPLLKHVLAAGEGLYPASTAECARDLDELEVPLDATNTTARMALSKAGKGKAAGTVSAALKWRRDPTYGLSNDASNANRHDASNADPMEEDF